MAAGCRTSFASARLMVLLDEGRSLRWATLLLGLAALLVLWPLWPPLVLAAWTAALTRPLLVRFERGLRVGGARRRRSRC